MRRTARLKIAAIVFFLVPLCGFAQHAHAATITWDGGGADSNWSTCANWSGDICPGSADVATFNTTSTKDSTIDASFTGTAAGISIAAGYTGTITQSRNITIGVSGFTQAGGTFNQGTTTFTMDSAFTVSGGTFNAGAGTSVINRNFTLSGGTYNASSTRQITFGGGSGAGTTFTCTGTFPGTISIAKTQNNGNPFTLVSGCTVTTAPNVSTLNQIVINGTITFTGTSLSSSGVTVNNGGSVIANGVTNSTYTSTGLILNAGSTFVSDASSITVTGNFTLSPSATFTVPNATFVFSGGSGQATTFTCTGTFANAITIAKTTNNGNSFTLASGCSVTASSNMSTLSPVTINGTLDLAGHNLSAISGLTISSTGTLIMQGTETVTTPTLAAGSTVTYNGTGTYPSLKLGTSYSNLSFTGSGTYATSSNITVARNFTQTAGTFNHTGTLTFTGTSAYTLTASAGTNLKNVTLNGSGLTLTLAGSSLALTGGLTITAGTLDVSASGCSSASCNISLAGNWSNSGTFTPRIGTVTLTGTGQSLAGSTTFYDLTKSVTAADMLTFPASATQTITHTLTLNGASGNLLTVQSSSPGTQWSIDPQGTRTVSFLSVKDSNNTNVTVITTAGLSITDAGNNTNWNFNTAPDAPASLGPAQQVDGSVGNSRTPELTFTLSDPDADPIRYEIQIDDASDFSSPAVDYLSATAAGGATSFTVGQDAGSGAYIAGASGQALADGSYYWEVRASDTAATSTYTVANSGSVAFSIEATAPIASTTAPADGAVVSGNSVTLSADAADNVGIAGVTFYVDGILQGSESTAAPYSIVWDSTATTSGSHTFFAVARDTSDNYGTSTVTAFTVTNAGPSPSSIAADPSSEGATITWATATAASSRVYFGPSSAHGSSTPEIDTAPRVTDHSVVLASLPSCTLFHYVVVSTDALLSAATSTDATFSTTGCSGSATILSTEQASIPSAGGGTLSHGPLMLTVPAAFTGVASDAIFQANELDSSAFLAGTGAPVGTQYAKGGVYELKAFTDTLQPLSSFLAPLTVQLTYAPADIAGVQEPTLAIYRYDSGSWTLLTGCTADTNAHTVSCQTSSFSDFALFGTPVKQSLSKPRYSGTSVTQQVRNLIDMGNITLAQSIMRQWPNLFPEQMPAAIARASLPVPANSPVVPVSHTPSFAFTHDLQIGANGTDVYELQKRITATPGGPAAQALISNGLTHYFGPLTQAALAEFQNANGIAPAAGYFGPLTRAYIAAH